MKQKKDIQKLTSQQINHLDKVLTNEDLTLFKSLIPELKDTWNKKQVFRTETEMRFSVLNDARHPTQASKYWQCVREQNTHFNQLLETSFKARKVAIELEQVKRKFEEETDDLEKELLKIDIEQKIFAQATLELQAKHRMREVATWSKIKKELDKGKFNTKDPNIHQLDSYHQQYVIKSKSLNQFTAPEASFNIIGQLSTIARIKNENNTIENKRNLTKKISKKNNINGIT
tara:strand:+ start:1020 stop:1712 length:693 start_codon:yes stop_codon:yes gene_type:complete